KQLVAGNAAGPDGRVVAARQRVAMETVAADGGLDATDDGGRGLAAELLVEDRPGQRIDRVEALAPARIGFDHPDPLHPRGELAIALRQVGMGCPGIETARVPGQGLPFAVT